MEREWKKCLVTSVLRWLHSKSPSPSPSQLSCYLVTEKKCLSFSPPREPQIPFSSSGTPDILSTYMRINSILKSTHILCPNKSPKGRDPPEVKFKAQSRQGNTGTSLVVQPLRICLAMQETWIWSLVGEVRDPTCHRSTKPMHHNERSLMIIKTWHSQINKEIKIFLKRKENPAPIPAVSLRGKYVNRIPHVK